MKINFYDLKRKTDILPELLRWIPSGEIKKSSKCDKYYCLCWLHTEDTPSMCINTDTNTFHCYGCGSSGSVLDVRLHFMGLNPSSGIDLVKAAKAILADAGNLPARVEDFEPLKVVKTNFQNTKRRYYVANAERIENSHRRLIESSFSAKDYASRRGWLEKRNPYPIGVGSSYGPGANYAALEFPKLIQTRQTAISFGFEKEWDSWGGSFCLDLKKRLTPEAEKAWDEGIKRGETSEHIKKPPRWSAIPEYHDWVPWEFDSRSARTADILCVTEGPGDGLRLENELIRNGVEYNYHVASVDSASVLRSQNFTRVLMEKKTINFFDNFKEIVFFFDLDRAGLQAEESAYDLLEKLRPKGRVKFARIPRIGETVKDLSDYFDNEGCVADLLFHLDRTDQVTF